jgi:hypothetical protein
MPSIALNLNDMSVVRNYSGALENVSARAEQAGSALFDVGSILWGAGSTISNMFQYLLSADGLQSVGKVVTYPLNLAGKAMGGGFQLFEEGIDKGVILSLDGKEKVSNGVEKALNGARNAGGKALNGAGKALENGTGKGIEVFAGAADKTISCVEGIFSFVKGDPFASPEMVETTTSLLRNGL